MRLRSVAPVLFDTGTMRVLPTKVRSPLTHYLMGGKTFDIIFEETGPAVPVIDYQVDHAFSGVAEHVMKKLIDELGISPPSAFKATRLSDYWALVLMSHYAGDMGESTVREKMLSREEDLLDASYLDLLDQDAIYDMIDVGDQKTATAFVEETNKAKADRKGLVDCVNAMVREFFGPAAATKKPKKDDAAVAAGTCKSKTEWCASVKCEWKAVVELQMPVGGKVVVDDHYGRFLVSIHSRGPKSVSWTRRGGPEAARLALAWLWRQHADVCPGVAVPSHFLEDDG
eukprot:TRINITY_DN26124_c0_g2_i1.p1 TRINITY_DN26124_c0_g2~~TRINITY_DN26124_c0_g2_i1.p1  ORF type:complete len:285 (-),score=67.83 TRINITY_DN26124_c0_g2_i1:475-1329(-)